MHSPYRCRVGALTRLRQDGCTHQTGAGVGALTRLVQGVCTHQTGAGWVHSPHWCRVGALTRLVQVWVHSPDWCRCGYTHQTDAGVGAGGTPPQGEVLSDEMEETVGGVDGEGCLPSVPPPPELTLLMGMAAVMIFAMLR